MDSLGLPVSAPPDYAALRDADLVGFATRAQALQNALHARRLGAYAELYARCERDHQARRATAAQPRFVLTPGEETGLEFAAALSVTPVSVQADVTFVHRLREHFPDVWARCESGRLGLDKAAVILEAAESIADPADVVGFAALIDDYLSRHDDPTVPLLPLTRQQISNAARYRKLKFGQKDDEQSFHEAFARRRVRLRLDDNGIGHLGCTNQAGDLLAADHRLTLIAKKLCESDERGRTLDQMRADVVLDLILGRLDVRALTCELEADETVDGRDPGALFDRHPVGAFARPVVLVTIPITTLMGRADEPGLLSGDIPLPAEAARLIAADPASTWHRLLTDEAGDFLHLSTTSYTPTAPIWRTTVARDRTCVWPGCCRPSARCHLDHRVPHPEGETCICNLQPLCPRHHKGKHSEAFTLRRDADGGYTLSSARGTRAHRAPTGQPVPAGAG